MSIDKPIFGLRFGSNEDLQPLRDQLDAFLDRMKADGTEPHRADVMRYRDLIAAVQKYREMRPREAILQNFREKVYYGVIGHTHFANHALQVVVEQYKYHLHELLLLDFRKPSAFIRSAEEEIGTLNLKRQDDVRRMYKLQDMMGERRKMLDERMQRREDLSRELIHIAVYVRDNVHRIERLCMTALVVLKDINYGQQREAQILDDIKTSFKDGLREALQNGTVTKERLEAVKKSAEVLLKDTTTYLREDVRALAWMYQAVHDHAAIAVNGINAQLPNIKRSWENNLDGVEQALVQIEKVLVHLVSGFHFDLKLPSIRTETEHKPMLMEKRKEMLDHLFELLRRERRARKDRRVADERRKYTDPDDTGPERRNRGDRRGGRDRRWTDDTHI